MPMFSHRPHICEVYDLNLLGINLQGSGLVSLQSCLVNLMLP